MVEPITISLVASGTAFGCVSASLTGLYAAIRILKLVDNKFHIIDKIKSKIASIRDKRATSREQKEAMKAFAALAADPEIRDSIPNLIKKVSELESRAAAAREVDSQIKSASANTATATANVRVEYPRVADIRDGVSSHSPVITAGELVGPSVRSDYTVIDASKGVQPLE